MQTSTQQPPRKIFALGGEIVSTSFQAKRILVDAIRLDKEWLIPQAESVLQQLRQQEAGAV